MPTWPKIRPWLFSITLVFAFGLAGFFWLKMKMMEVETSQAIYVTGTLVDGYHIYWREHGAWPAPGSILARDVVFVRSVRNGANSGTDVFNFGGGVFACLSLSSNGKITALPSRGTDHASLMLGVSPNSLFFAASEMFPAQLSARP